MEEKVIIKLSRKIEYLVHKRHRSLRHIQKVLSSEGEGAFWMNSVFLNRKAIMKIIATQIPQAEIQIK